MAEAAANQFLNICRKLFIRFQGRNQDDRVRQGFTGALRKKLSPSSDGYYT